MGRINMTRVILGGLAAGLVINIVETVVNMFLIKHVMDDLLASLNRDPIGAAAGVGYMVLAFLLGILIVWTYAAIRPRYGAGAKTALRAGLAVWAAFYLLGVGSNWLMGIAPTHLYIHNLLYSLPMMLIAGWVGGWLYREA